METKIQSLGEYNYLIRLSFIDTNISVFPQSIKFEDELAATAALLPVVVDTDEALNTLSLLSASEVFDPSTLGKFVCFCCNEVESELFIGKIGVFLIGTSSLFRKKLIPVTFRPNLNSPLLFLQSI
jgi:hypothetical protein